MLKVVLGRCPSPRRAQGGGLVWHARASGTTHPATSASTAAVLVKTQGSTRRWRSSVFGDSCRQGLGLRGVRWAL
eukprot:1624757-Pyramimonas_sp.AAC.1